MQGWRSVLLPPREPLPPYLPPGMTKGREAPPGAPPPQPCRPEWSPRLCGAGTPGSGSLPSTAAEPPQSPMGGWSDPQPRPCPRLQRRQVWKGPSGRSRDLPGDRGPGNQIISAEGD